MNILVLCDQRSVAPDVGLKAALEELLLQMSQDLEIIVINAEKLEPCIGCFSCWVKTPGQCFISTDSANEIAAKEVNAEVLVILSENTYGGFSADIKAFLDRSVQNILPFFVVHKKQMHHPKRYQRFPNLLTISYGDNTTKEKETFLSLADRNALNMHPKRYLAINITDKNDLLNNREKIQKFVKETSI